MAYPAEDSAHIQMPAPGRVGLVSELDGQTDESCFFSAIDNLNKFAVGIVLTSVIHDYP